MLDRADASPEVYFSKEPPVDKPEPGQQARAAGHIRLPMCHTFQNWYLPVLR